MESRLQAQFRGADGKPKPYRNHLIARLVDPALPVLDLNCLRWLSTGDDIDCMQLLYISGKFTKRERRQLCAIGARMI
jgi:hypothetical protein